MSNNLICDKHGLYSMYKEGILCPVCGDLPWASITEEVLSKEELIKKYPEIAAKITAMEGLAPEVLNTEWIPVKIVKEGDYQEEESIYLEVMSGSFWYFNGHICLYKEPE